MKKPPERRSYTFKGEELTIDFAQTFDFEGGDWVCRDDTEVVSVEILGFSFHPDKVSPELTELMINNYAEECTREWE